MKQDKLPPMDKCDGCGRQSASTVCAICLGCAQRVLRQRRAMFPRSEGNVYMARQFGLRNYFNLDRSAT